MQPVLVTWPGGRHPMCLAALQHLEGLQTATDAGPEFLLNKLRLGQWSASDLFEILRWGLIGGGMGALEAEKLVQRLWSQHPKAAFKSPALEVMAHALYGPADDAVGDDAGGKSQTVPDPTPDEQKTESGSSPTSTDQAQ